MKILNTKWLGAVVLLTLLAGCNQAPPDSPMQQTESVQVETTTKSSAESFDEVTQANQDLTQEADSSERLGTAWGDEVESSVTQVDLRRTSNDPIEQMQVHYADKNYAGRPINTVSLLAGKIEFSAETDRQKLSLYRDKGNYYLKGRTGESYRLVYQNNSDNIYEVVASVDGLNVMNGDSASRYDGGYVLYPHDELVIDGFRKSQDAVASFTFSRPDDAYAANTDSGSIQNTGIIGTALYELYDPSQPKPKKPQAFPEDNGYAKPPR